MPRVCQPHSSASDTGSESSPVGLVKEEETVAFRICLCGQLHLMNWVWGRITCNPSSWSSAIWSPLFRQSCISRHNLQASYPLFSFLLKSTGWPPHTLHLGDMEQYNPQHLDCMEHARQQIGQYHMWHLKAILAGTWVTVCVEFVWYPHLISSHLAETGLY